MRIFRIADNRHPIFDGTGASLLGGRWNSKGKRVIYASETYAGALLEALVHANIGRMPRHQAWIEIRIPENLPQEHIDRTNFELSNAAASREFGDRWYDEQRSAVLVVPSIVTGGVENNIIINQRHFQFGLLEASVPKTVEWDPRLFSDSR
jgi:RES domain-containing protein